MDLQKLLLLYCKETQSKHYDFVPYKYGAYSYQCARDLETLKALGWIEVLGEKRVRLRSEISDEGWVRNNDESEKIHRWLSEHPLRGDQLIVHSYREYPYFAIRSHLRGSLLSKSVLARVHASQPVIRDNEKTLFTVGYEGMVFETWLNILIRSGIKVVCDIRRNPRSRKYGFSQQSLATRLPNFDMEYVHLPLLGIEGSQRKHLKSKEDYRLLFARYKRRLSSPDSIDKLDIKRELKRIVELLENRRRMALVCFEADHERCHRHCLSDYLSTKCPCRVVHL